MNVPFERSCRIARSCRSTKPENNIPSVDLPVNVGVIKCGSELIPLRYRLEAAGLSEDDRSEHWAPLPDQLKVLGFNAADVTKVVIGHAHWDHAGQLSDLPNAVLYVQRESSRRSSGRSTIRSRTSGRSTPIRRLQSYARLRYMPLTIGRSTARC